MSNNSSSLLISALPAPSTATSLDKVSKEAFTDIDIKSLLHEDKERHMFANV